MSLGHDYCELCDAESPLYCEWNICIDCGMHVCDDCGHDVEEDEGRRYCYCNACWELEPYESDYYNEAVDDVEFE